MYVWYTSFKEGQVKVENETHARTPGTSTTKDKLTDVEALIQDSQRNTKKLEISVGSVETLVKDYLKFSKLGSPSIEAWPQRK